LASSTHGAFIKNVAGIQRSPEGPKIMSIKFNNCELLGKQDPQELNDCGLIPEMEK
jgi:hypothetical protein